MGKRKKAFDDEEILADLEKRLEEDFPDDVFNYDEDEDFDEDDFFDDDLYPSYYQAAFNFPLVNIHKGVTDQNFGYAQGITYKGVPFAAEVYDQDDSEFLVVYIPAFIWFPEKYEVGEKIKKDLKKTTGKMDILDIGMYEVGEETDNDQIITYLNFLIANDLVVTVTPNFKATVSYRIDKNGTKLAKVTITLVDNDGFYAMTDLDMKLFFDGGEQVRPSATMFRMDDYR